MSSSQGGGSVRCEAGRMYGSIHDYTIHGYTN